MNTQTVLLANCSISHLLFQNWTMNYSNVEHCQYKVCSINFEPPDNDLCSTCHVYPLSHEATWSMDYLNTIYIEWICLGGRIT